MQARAECISMCMPFRLVFMMPQRRIDCINCDIIANIELGMFMIVNCMQPCCYSAASLIYMFHRGIIRKNEGAIRSLAPIGICAFELNYI